MRIVLTVIVLYFFGWGKETLRCVIQGDTLPWGSGKIERKILALRIASILSRSKKMKKLDHRRRTKLTRTIWAGVGG